VIETSLTTEDDVASHLESQWFDLIGKHVDLQYLACRDRRVPISYIGTSFYNEVSAQINGVISEIGLSPHSMFEVGTALGRVTYEMILKNSELEWVTLLEPSSLYLKTLKKFFTQRGKHTFPYMTNLPELGTIEFDTELLEPPKQNVSFLCLEQTLEETVIDRQYDLVICLNVIESARSVPIFAEKLLNSVNSGGILALACTYQWQAHHIQSNELISDTRSLFNNDWELMSDMDIKYSFRVNERGFCAFLSDLIILRKK